MPEMIESKDGLEEHQHRVICAAVVDARARNVLDGAHHVVAEVAHGSARKGRQIRNTHRTKAAHGVSKVLHEVRRFSLAVARQKEGITAEEGIPPDSFATFNAFEQESILLVPF